MENISERLLQAIKSDNLKSFSFCMEQSPCGTFRLGRFPILSLVYMYNAKKIAKAYEDKFLKISNWQQQDEPLDVANDFRKIAGKCLRFYSEEVVTPVEMLLILDQNSKLKKVFPKTQIPSAVRQRLKKIYSVKFALDVNFSGDSIVLDRRPLTNAEKKKVLLCCVSILLCVAILVGTPFVVNVFVPYIPNSQGQIAVTKLESVNFASNKTYLLKNDVILPRNFFADNVNCSILGNGKTVTVEGGTPFGKLNGNLSDITFKTQGDPLINTICYTSTVENVTLNVQTEQVVQQSTAFLAEENFGIVKNSTVNVSGSVSAVSASDEIKENFEIQLSGIVGKNCYTAFTSARVFYAFVQNCTANFNNLILVGQVSTNAAFCGVVGTNDGYVLECTATGSVTADTFDLAGICGKNNRLLQNCHNQATLSQTSAETQWNPLVSGIVNSNCYAVEGCTNSGSLFSRSTCEVFDFPATNVPEATAAGIGSICSRDRELPYFLSCKNYGDVEVFAKNRSVFAAGICASTNGVTEHCQNSGEISAQNQNENLPAFAAGVVCCAYGYVNLSRNSGNIICRGLGRVTVGGIVATSLVQVIGCVVSGEISGVGSNVYVGGVMGCSEVDSSCRYFGTVDSCVCSATVSASPIGEATLAVGGLVGAVQQSSQTVGGVTNYFGGGVTKSYFVGNCQTDMPLTFVGGVGAIVGICGKNILESNSYGELAGQRFSDNYCTRDCCESLPFGALFTLDANGNNVFFSGSSQGCEIISLQEIEADKVYKSILENIE